MSEMSAAQPLDVVHEPADTPQRPWWRQPLVLLVAGVVLILAVAITIITVFAGGSSRDLKVSFSLDDFGGSSSCAGGHGGYSDLGPGTDVVVKDDGGHIIGTAQLGDGKSTSMSSATGHDGVGGCIWNTTVKDLPSGKDYYQISVGRRGTETYSKAQLDKAKWALDLSIGGS